MITKIKFIILFTFTLIIECQAQTKLGIKAGGQLSNFQTKDQHIIDQSEIEGYDVKVGYHFGAFTQIKLSEKFQLQPELVWSQKGGRTITDNSIRFSYLSPTLLLGFKPIEKGQILLGGDIGVLMFTQDSRGRKLESNQKETLDFNLILGLEYQIHNKFTAGLRGAYGLNEVFDVSDIIPTILFRLNEDELKFSNIALQAYVSYRIF